MNIVLQTGEPSGFEIAQVLLVVMSLLIPAIVFLIGTYRSEAEIEGPLKIVVNSSPSSLGKALGLQALVIAILIVAINLIYVLFTVLFEGIVSVSIQTVGFLSGIGIVVVLIYILLLVWSLSSHGQEGKSEVKKLRDDVDKAILRQRNDQLREQLDQRKKDIAGLTARFKRLELKLQESEDIPDDAEELVEQLTERSYDEAAEGQSNGDESEVNSTEAETELER
jgi:uncharacterized membrane protein